MRLQAAASSRTGPDGVWEEHEVETCGHAGALRARPADTWRLFGGMRAPVRAAQANAAHRALAAFEAALAPHQSFLRVTQTIDGLHPQAGSRRVVEPHGNVMRTRCSNAACSLAAVHDDDGQRQIVPEARPNPAFPQQLLAPAETVRPALLGVDAGVPR